MQIAFRPQPTSTRSNVAPAKRSLRLVVRASASNDDPKGKLSKEEAARKALQDALKGSFGGKDILSNYDQKPVQGGGGGGDGGARIRKAVGEFGDGFRRRFTGFIKAISAVLIFMSILFVFQFYDSIVKFIQLCFIKLFRLDAPSARFARANTESQRRLEAELAAKKAREGQAALGGSEEAAISKWAADDDEEEK